jgi:hypothetical protein
MKRLTGIASAAAVLLLAAGAASAATVADLDGKNARKLANGDEVKGPARITAENGKDTITVREGGVVRFLGSDTDAKGMSESFFLKAGSCDADLGFYTRLATPCFWAFPESAAARSSFYAETFAATATGEPTAYARTQKGSGVLRLVLNPGARSNLEASLQAGQGVTLQRMGERDLRFSTDPHNEWVPHGVRIVYPLPTGLSIELFVPKATSGFIAPQPGAVGKTEVRSNTTSWKSGRVWIATTKDGATLQSDGIGPGVTAVIDEASGTIETGSVKVEFATLKAAVSLTSEFASLATSPLAKVGN